MNYIVLDLEWNQPPYMTKMIKKPIRLHGEIIQIGAVKLDENYHILDTFKIMVTPMYYKKMHKKVAKLTKISTEDLQYGFPFETAVMHFKRWCGDEFTFLTWGADDISMLKDNLTLHKINSDWLPVTYNLQIIFDKQITKENRQISLSAAMKTIGEQGFEAHDALNDARNTVCICLHLDMIKGLEEYEEIKKQSNQRQTQSSVNSVPDKAYLTRQEALNDPELTEFYCPTCGERVVCGNFLRQNFEKYICIGKCENGEEFFVRFKFSRWGKGFTVSRIIYEMDEEHRSYYNIKRQIFSDTKQAYLLSITA